MDRRAQPILSLHGVSKTFATGQQAAVTAVHDVDLDVEQGEFVVITGRSGSGKTTLLNLAAGLTRPSTGEVRLQGEPAWDLPDREQSLLRNRKIGFIFQFPSLLPSLNALENVMLPTLYGQKNGRSEAAVRAAELLATVGLGDKLEALPRQLSAGQQQRVVIARALINRPELLFADEATSDLDEQTECEIMDLLADCHARMGLTILMVTHTGDLVRYGTCSIRMVGGAIVSTIWRRSA